jgi:predicted DNA-binding transcriptional regulator AlpA
MKNERLLRLWDITGCKKRGIKGIVPCSKSTLYRRIEEGSFPKPIRISRVAWWKESDIINFIDAL